MISLGLSQNKRKSKEVRIGNLSLGANNPVRIKGMLKASTRNSERLLKEAKRLEKEGTEAIRVAVKNKKDTQLATYLKKKISIPLVADIHFNYRLALLSINGGFDGIRLNPLNIYRQGQVREVVKEAKEAKISIRVGVNSGGFKKSFHSEHDLAYQMVKIVTQYLRIFEREGFFDTIVSLKGSSVYSTVLANREFSKRFDYPLHIGITATGPFLEGAVKSSLGVGILLSEGIGDVIRISLTAPSFWEIRVAKYILQFLGLRKFFCEVISCPTCSRCEVNLVKIVNRFKKNINKLPESNLLGRVAIMGCVVNGPGEAYQADMGVAFGKKRAVIFRKDNILGLTSERKVTYDLINKVKGEVWK